MLAVPADHFVQLQPAITEDTVTGADEIRIVSAKPHVTDAPLGRWRLRQRPSRFGRVETKPVTDIRPIPRAIENVFRFHIVAIVESGEGRVRVHARGGELILDPI